ncbi:MAG TPA: hypothetical protein VJH22_06445 [Candidatus Nanoarchaeia archaeon]|nr:hypothetical protein [Candidatus Nanoarchaeia archaeon]
MATRTLKHQPKESKYSQLALNTEVIQSSPSSIPPSSTPLLFQSPWLIKTVKAKLLELGGQAEYNN